MLAERTTIAERVVETGTRGEGGDRTLEIDALAEEAVFAELNTLYEAGARFTVVSEERGTVDFGGDGTLVVVDPIDGSLNAKRDIRFFSLSVAVADGETMDDVVFGYVYDFGTGEEWTAERGRGAFRNGEPLGAVRPKDEIEILSFEATTTAEVADRAAQMVGSAHRLRIMGSLALSLCHLAAGRVDAVCSLKPARSVDIAAGQLLVRELGLAIELFEAPPFGRAPLDLVGRSRVVAAGTTELCRTLQDALTA
jgi:myo-inositol-1(or 4)-monophosphatase